jgi:hypothetical protein
LGLFDRIRAGAAAVSERARFVRIEDSQLQALLPKLLDQERAESAVDPAQHEHASPEETLAYVVTLDAINFGSGWFPHLKKRPGCSGYFTVAGAMKDHFAEHGAWKAEEMATLTAEQCASVFEQDAPTAGSDDSDEPIAELMELFAHSLRDLGEELVAEYQGRFENLVESAAGSAETLACKLREMPFYRDESRYEELEVPFYKRAQLTSSDLSAAFGGEGFGRFDDLDRLTIFADNLVPHVLRREGALVYAEELAERIDREEPLEPGSMEEVEIRAVAVHAVERMAEAARAGVAGERGTQLTAGQLDTLLWTRGHRPEMKAHPRHRARSVFY